MNNLNSFKDSSCEKNNSNEINDENNNKLEKVLCNHCGRTISNGIRCKGICVADSDY